LQSISHQNESWRPKSLVEDYGSASTNSGGKTERKIALFAIVNNGLRWQVRAFDRKTGKFRDFVLTRILFAKILEENIKQEKSYKNVTEKNQLNWITEWLIEN